MPLIQTRINAVTSQGDTALHGAAAEGYNRVIQLLADRGALLSVKNKRGQTPLQVALIAGQPNVPHGRPANFGSDQMPLNTFGAVNPPSELVGGMPLLGMKVPVASW